MARAGVLRRYRPPDRERLRLPLGSDRLLLAVLDRVTRHAVRGLADQDPAGGRERLETRGRVDDVAGDDSLARARLGVERDERLAAVDRDPEFELGRERVADRECGADGAFGVILMRHRRAERGHDRIADELLDRSAESLDLRAYAFEVRALKRAHVLRIELLRLRREADQVAEEDRDQLPLLARSGSGTVSRGRSERRILAEDLMLEPFERRPGLERELVGEETAALLVHLQRVGLPARAVEREHQFAAQALAERIRRHQPLQLRYELRDVGRARAPRRCTPRARRAAAPRAGRSRRARSPRSESRKAARRGRARARAAEARPASQGPPPSEPPPRARRNGRGRSYSGRRRSAYPGGRVSIASAPSSFRSADTCPCNAFAAVSGGSGPHKASISSSVPTTSPPRSSSSASSARCFGRAGVRSRPSSTTSKGPRTRTSTSC